MPPPEWIMDSEPLDRLKSGAQASLSALSSDSKRSEDS
jgi:hypothetical protein